MIVAVDLDSTRAKGVEHLLLQHDEQGFFEHVFLVCPYQRVDRQIALSARHDFFEFGFVAGRWLRRLLAPVHLLRIIVWCARLVHRERISVIRATEPTLCGFVAWAASRISGIPYVLSLHADYDKLFALDGRRGAPTLFGRRWGMRPLEWLTFRGATRVWPIRKSLVPYALARGVHQSRVRIIPHGIELRCFLAPPRIDVHCELGLPLDKAILAFAGRLSPENYIEDMLTAASRLAAVRDDFVLVLAGGGPLEDTVAGRMQVDAALRRVVRSVGFLPHDQVLALRSVAAVSLCLMGGFSLIEACAAGRPVIAYDVDWHHELVVDGRTGRLLPEHDIAGIVDAISQLLDDAPNASRMGAEARALAIARHDLAEASGIRRKWYSEILST